MSEGGNGYVPTAADKKPAGGAGAGAASKETEASQAYLLMEDVADKLKLLDYEVKFCKGFARGSLKPLRPTYFATQASNAAEQFFYMNQLVCWLASLCGQRITPPARTDDPNAVTATLIEELKRMGFPVDFPPNRLRQGHGEVVCGVLSSLINAALAAAGFGFEQPQHPEPPPTEDGPTAEDALADEADEAADADDLVDENLEADDDDEVPETRIEHEKIGQAADPAQWKVEVERVAPLLRVHLVQDPKDWRSRTEQLKKQYEAIGGQLNDTRTSLERVATEIDRDLDKIATHEKYMNEQFSTLVQEHRTATEEMQKVQEQYKLASDRVNVLSKDLTAVVDELTAVKEEVDTLGNAITDTSPVLRMKQALARIKDEIAQMEVRIGVAEHTLLRAKMKEKHHALNPNAQLELNAMRIGMTEALMEDDGDGFVVMGVLNV
eukprot:m51a1_g8341 putative intraflagellar transport protein 57 homolog (438) ;mRNA; r:17105-18795